MAGRRAGAGEVLRSHSIIHEAQKTLMMSRNRGTFMDCLIMQIARHSLRTPWLPQLLSGGHAEGGTRELRLRGSTY